MVGIRHFVFVFVALFFASMAKAFPIPSRTIASPVLLESSLQVVEDEQANFKPFTPHLQQLFSDASPRSPAIGYTKSVWWAQIVLDNPFHTDETRYLELEDSGEGMPEITFFIKSSRGETREVISGGYHRHSKGTLENNFIVVPITFQPLETITVQIRIQGDSVNVPIHIHTPKSFLVENYHKMIWMGVSYGVLILLMLYNFALFFATKDKSYMYYVGFIFFLGLTLSGFDGLSAQYFLREYPFWNARLINMASALCAAFLILFTHHFLRIQRHRPHLSRTLRTLALVCIVIALGNALTKINLVTNLAVSATSLLCFVGTAAMFSKQRQLVIAFTIPLFFFIAGSLFTTARLASLLPINFWTLNSLRIGMILNALFWSTALSYRIRLVIRETFDAENTLLHKKKESEIAARENLTNRLSLIEALSHKLTNPLNTLLSELETLQVAAKQYNQGQRQPPGVAEAENAFWKEWQSKENLLSASTQKLASLSTTLQDFKQQLTILTKKEGGLP